LGAEEALGPVHPVPDRDLALEGALVPDLGEGPDAALDGDLDKDLSTTPVPLALALPLSNPYTAAHERKDPWKQRLGLSE